MSRPETFCWVLAGRSGRIPTGALLGLGRERRRGQPCLARLDDEGVVELALINWLRRGPARFCVVWGLGGDRPGSCAGLRR
jgi:hypothetical protein